MQEDDLREMPYLQVPTPSPTPSLRFHRLSPVPLESALSDQRNLSQIGAGLPGGEMSRQDAGIPELDVESSNDLEEQLGGLSVNLNKRRKKRKRGGTSKSSAPDPSPAKRICNRGGTKAIKRHRRDDRPQESHFHSEDEVPGDEALEQSLLPSEGLDDSYAEKQCLPEKARHFVLALSLACRDVTGNTSSGALCSISQLFQPLQGLLPDPKELPASDDDSLENLAMRCIRSETLVSNLDFVYMLNCIQLRCKVLRHVFVILADLLLLTGCLFCSISIQTKTAPTTILAGVKTSRSRATLFRYMSDGAKFCLLAGGGKQTE